MMTVTYDLDTWREGDQVFSAMAKCVGGAYVLAEDYEALQSELAAAKESRDRESVAYDKLNAAYIDLNLELGKLRTTEYEHLLGEKDAQIDALRAKNTELKTRPLYSGG